MVALPTEPKTTLAIYDHYKKERNGPPRPYLGGSQIGESCERKLFYSFRWALPQAFEGRILRLFETGFREEDRIIANLKAIGCTVNEINPNTNTQYRYSDHGGHYSGGIDGVVFNLPDAPKTWHLLEVKTHNLKSYTALKKDGVEKSKPVHFAQMQSYMKMTGLKRAVCLAVCKNDDSIYVERLKYEPKKAKAIHTKALRIIDAKTPPEKIREDPAYYECKWCNFYSLCHEEKVAEVNCRTCVHVTPELDGAARWSCARYDCDIPEENQRKGCESHLHIPELIPYATPIDAGDDWVKYQIADGREFIECAPVGFPADKASHYSSKEIAAINLDAIADPTMDAARTILNGEVIG